MGRPHPQIWAHSIVSERDLPWLEAELAADARLAGLLAADTESRAFYADRVARLSKTIAAIKAQAKESV